MKSQLKKMIPQPIKKGLQGIIDSQWFRKHYHERELKKFMREDFQRFDKYSSYDNSTMDHDNIRSQLVYYTHQIEKGLSRRNFRSGFGKNAINNLVDAVMRMRQLPNYQSDDFYLNAISALRRYKEKHGKTIGETPNFKNIPTIILDEIDECENEFAGIHTISSASKIRNGQMNFKELALNRYSIRDFKQDEHIDMNHLRDAIQISLKSPSVCNRQPSRVTAVTDKTLIQKVLNLQGGFRGYETPDKLLLVTSDLAYFLRAQERNQGQIDGGLFSMSLLYSLEYEGIAACPLSANIKQQNLEEVRKLLKVPDREAIIMFIVCGVMEDEVKTPKGYRTDIDNIFRVVM